MILRRLLGLAPLATLTLAVSLSGGEDPSLAAVLAADQARGAALLAADLPALERILADDFRYTHSSGHLETKAIHLGTIRQGLRYTRFETSKLHAHSVTPDVVVLSGTIDQVKTRDGKIDAAHLLFQAVWRQRQNRWQLVSLQTVKPPPPAVK